MNQESQQEVQTVVASLVAEKDRNTFTPNLFSERYFMQAENVVFSITDNLSVDYDGGLWDFFTLSNGGAFMAPSADHEFNVLVESNGFEGVLSANAVGVVATLFALNYLGTVVLESDEKLAEYLFSKYHLLREFSLDHEEHSLILGAID